MSHPLPAAAEAAYQIDWKVVAGALGTFLATLVTIIWGWWKGEKKAKEKNTSHIRGEGDIMVTGAVLQDNMSLRENTQSNRDLRDQVMLSTHAIERHTKACEDMTNALEAAIEELKNLRRTL